MRETSVAFQVGDITLAGQLYTPGQGNQAPYPTVCVCHGIPARLPDPADRGYPLLAQRVCRQGFAVLIFNFRGCGASGGDFDMLGWTADLGAAIDLLWTLPQVDKSRLALLGFSGGAAAAVYAAARDQRVALVAAVSCPAEFTFVESGDPQPVIEHFRSVGIIRDAAFPPSVSQWLDGFRQVSPIRHVAGIAPRRLLLVHGSHDDTVPVAHARRLYAAAGEPRQLAVIEGAGHRLRLNEEAMSTVIDWLKLFGRPPAPIN